MPRMKMMTGMTGKMRNRETFARKLRCAEAPPVERNHGFYWLGGMNMASNLYSTVKTISCSADEILDRRLTGLVYCITSQDRPWLWGVCEKVIWGELFRTIENFHIYRH